ncbi:MAG: hypothetical protein A2Z86_09420 [Candidatus Glassbacteria bacterium GWA2_58_10]|uniref:Uncharacterized protein n=1 Tax=Candidatus Glassbacteria bacterium GWA2_58_10 TaxID=1817865 RepID=A0A1F5YGM3_9BACT|nr:MAG: hypothetical protein A2Z86_09420 [Candidatus Glassbacteria bacterium GWA2_58_10]
MSRYLFIIVVFMGIFAACGKDSGPAGPTGPELAKYNLVGEWQGTANLYRIKTPSISDEDSTLNVNSLEFQLIITDESYQLEAYHSDAYTDFSLTEEGRWSWFKETGEYLFFNALQSNLVTVQRQRSQAGEMTIRSNRTWGERAWQCRLEYDHGLQTLKLFNFDNIFDFGTLVLTKKKNPLAG